MSHTRVMARFETSGFYNSIIEVPIYCHHNHSCDIVTFKYEDGSVVDGVFEEVGSRGKWEVMMDLMSPFKDKQNGQLKDGIEYYTKGPWEK